MATTLEMEVLKANNQFTLDMYNVLAKKSQDNLLFSPISAHCVLSMGHNAAAGATKEAFAKTLHNADPAAAAKGYNSLISSMNDIKQVTLLMANAAFANKNIKLKSSYQKCVAEQFLSEVQQVDYQNPAAATQHINSWVNEKTKEKIPTLFGEGDITPDVALVLVNAIYFKGFWKNQFKKSQTTTEPFFVTPENKIDCQMMHISENFDYKIDEELNAKVLKLPFYDDVSMIIILPKEKNKIADLEAKFATYDLNKLTTDMYNTKIDVSIPKFKMEQTIDLQETLQELGLGIIFGQQCDMSEMTEGGIPVYVSKVVQKAFIEVNEEGAEAAAATGMVFMKRCYRRNPKFYANHPFIITLGIFKESASKVLFCGRVINPVSGDTDVGPRAEPNDDECMACMFRCAMINPKFYANHPFIVFLGIFKENASKVLFCGRVSKPISGDPDIGPRAEPNDRERHIM